MVQLPFDPSKISRELARHYIPASEADIRTMFATIGAKDFSDLDAHIDPAVKFTGVQDLPAELEYQALADRMEALAQKNSVKTPFLGDGLQVYQTHEIVGHVCSNASLAASDVYAANGIVMITAASVAAKLTDRGLPTIFRVCGRDDDQAKLSAAILAERFRDRRIAILNDLSPASRTLAAATKDNLNRIGVNEAMAAAFQPSDADDVALADRLKAANIDVVYYGGDAQEMGRLVRIAAERGFRPQWFGTSAIATPDFAKIAGPASNGVLMTFYLDPSRKPEAQGVVAEFKAQGVEADGSMIYGYAALQALVEAGNFAHSTEPAAIAKALHGERFDLVLGPVGFDNKGDITAQGYVLYVWRDGNFTPAKSN